MLKNLKVGARLALGFGLMIILLVSIAALSVLRLNELSSAVHLLVNDRYVKVAQINDAINHVNIIARALRNMILWGGNLQEVSNEENRILTSRAATTEIINNLTVTIVTEEGRRRLATLDATRQQYFAGQNTIINLAKLGRDDSNAEATGLLLSSYRTQQANYIAAWESLREYQSNLAKADSEMAERTTNQAMMIIIGIGIAATIIALMLALLITRSIVNPLGQCMDAAIKLAKGETDIEFKIDGKDELSALQREMKTMTGIVQALVAEAAILTKAAVDGRLETRGKAANFKGGYHDIVAGVNSTLDAVIGPLNVAASYVDRISKGDIPPKITDTYNGDFNVLKNNLNVCIDAVGSLVADAGMLAQAAIEGRLQTRADAGKHLGDFRKIVEGVNKTLDLVIDPVNETIAILKRMAEGDLTPTMTGDYRGDFDVLKTALNDTLASINDLLGQVTMAVEQVTSGSQQVSQASQALSQGATEQASSLEEITSSITQIAGQTRQNTENAVQVNGLAKTARDDAEQGNIQMKDLVSAMSDINSSAEEIRKIVKAIDDISFQINLLALNANVEAARAGKYGKGFAVVAEEVRNLAVRSAGSVQETTKMVDVAISNIAKGNGLVDVTAKQLQSIVGGAAQVASLAEEVATAGKEQSQGLEQVTTGLNQIDQVTQSNTASAEESASAAEELSSQSQQLKAMLAKFKLKAREQKLTNDDVMRMLQAEMGRQGYQNRSAGITLRRDSAPVSQPGPQVQGTKLSGKQDRRLVNPADVIALDDDDFGKF
jgi:methyl-accepting chemotaxis protein